MEDGEGQP